MYLKKMEERSCLNCEHFHWWDGDFCCLHPDGDWKILFESENGDFPDDLENMAIDACDKWSKCKFNIYMDL